MADSTNLNETRHSSFESRLYPAFTPRKQEKTSVITSVSVSSHFESSVIVLEVKFSSDKSALHTPKILTLIQASIKLILSWEFQICLYGLCPTLLRHLLPQ